ncbi:hypothetical protein FRC04_005242 [Tulasnella sp. 424]|nr:hypothetical protein FRC04_005242 [Tulasnella sp. 424]
MTVSLGMFMVFAATIARDPFNLPILKKSSISALVVNVATDVAITGLTLWKLGRGGEMYGPQTQHGLRRLRNMTVEAAVPPTVCVILMVASFLGMDKTNELSVFFSAINPALYVWSMMFTLNSRVAIRQKFNAWNDNEDDTLSAGFQFARPQTPHLKSEQMNVEEANITLITRSEPLYPARASMISV